MADNTMYDEHTHKPPWGFSCKPQWIKWCHNGCPFWCKKYFWEGQLNKNDTDCEIVIDVKDELFQITPTRRKVMALIIPAILFNICWWAIIINNNYWYLFKDKYPMVITMTFGSMIGGMTSEAGGAIVFPVMTLVLGLAPEVARDFSFMIQSCGLTAASFTIHFMKIKLERAAILFSSIGGFCGVIFGLYVIDNNLTVSQKKMSFVSIWFSFAFALYLLNRNNKRTTFLTIPNLNILKICILCCTGFVGGCFSSYAGSGIDICSFSILCLLFRVSEKVATPTSVVLMAINTVFGFFWRGLVMQEISIVTWEYMFVCVPVVVIGAPLGSLVGSHFHRLVLAAFIYIIDTVALVGAFCIVPQTPALAGMAVGIIVAFFLFFLGITKVGTLLMEKQLQLSKTLGFDTQNGVVVLPKCESTTELGVENCSEVRDNPCFKVSETDK